MTGDELRALLPALHRIRDDGTLRELLDLVAEPFAVVDESLAQLYDDEFAETCAEWVAPYLGDLVGYRPLHGVVPSVASPRAEVANTIRYRRRKGTASMLEQLARDVTGWPARAVEFFERLVWTQHVNHVRDGKGGTPDLRRVLDLELAETAFDDLPHTPDVRRIATGAGRHNIPNVGIFLWRVAAVPVRRQPLVPADAGRRRFRVDPLGTDRQLYAAPRTEEDVTHLAEPFDVPAPLSRRWLAAHRAHYYGPNRSLFLDVAGGTTPAHVRVCDLSDVPGGWAHEPAAGSGLVAVDPVLGRVCFADAVPAGGTPVASYHYGSALEVGGGGYDRGAPVAGDEPPVAASGGASLQPLLDAAAAGGVVEVTDSWRYEQTPRLAPAAGAALTLRAANRQRPLIAAGGPVEVSGGAGSTVVLEGLLVTGGALVLAAQADVEPRHLVLRHCTLVPGLTRDAAGDPEWPGLPSLRVLHPFAEVTIDRCVLGGIVAVEGTRITVKDSVVDACGQDRVAYAGDGDGFGGALTLDETTVVGRVRATELSASNSLLVARLPEPPPPNAAWPAPVWVRRRQVGCVRYTYVPPGSRVPRRFRDQPTEPGNRPRFTSLRYGDAGYAQLRPDTPDAIRRGADDEGEMGVTHYLYEPQREANLRLRLDEYLRFGLEAGPLYAS